MRKKFVFLLVIIFLFPIIVPSIPVIAEDSTQVCGVDEKNYSSVEEAENAGVDVSYNFACVNLTSENGLYEKENDINFAGMLVEVGSTDVPTTLIIRDNASKKDYTIEVNKDTVLGQRRDQLTNLSDWIPGDQIRVIGKKNENTDTVKSTILANLSIVVRSNKGANGWITAIDKTAKTITYQWANKEHTFNYNDDTRFVAGLKNPASVSDLKINDRIRGRLLLRANGNALAKIVVVLRRGPNLFMKIRTFRPNAILKRLNSTILPTTIQVEIKKTPGLKIGDVNNLIGGEGKLVTVNITEDTKIVRKYFGRTTLSEFSIDDQLHIVGRVNDDGSIDAKLIKNNSIWQTSTQGYVAVVSEINTDENYLMANWTPIKHITRKKLKEKIKGRDNVVSAQTVANISNISNINANKKIIKKNSLVKRLRDRIKSIPKIKIGKLSRQIEYKKININRISHKNLKIKDLITRMPVKKIRINITDDTKIIIGIDNSADISDIQIGDKIRIRGIKHATEPVVAAQTIVVVNSLPEIESDLNSLLDNENEVSATIITNTNDKDTTTETEIRINVE